jgi:PPM family protein phosphatase
MMARSTTPQSLTWRGAGLTDIGRVRRSNQDAFAVLNDVGLWIVADGMGGHVGGDVASRLAVESITEQIRRQAGAVSLSQAGQAWTETQLRQLTEAAHNTIRKHAFEHPHLGGMGTTIVVLSISSASIPRLSLAYVGDSRAYLLHAGALLQLSQDHSLVEEHVRSGRLSPEDAATHPLRHVLTRALGIEGIVEPDSSTHQLHPDDLILLCTDGLTKMMDDGQIADTLLHAGRSPEAACLALVEAANRRGGEDNVTVVVCTAST